MEPADDTEASKDRSVGYGRELGADRLGSRSSRQMKRETTFFKRGSLASWTLEILLCRRRETNGSENSHASGQNRFLMQLLGVFGFNELR